MNVKGGTMVITPVWVNIVYVKAQLRYDWSRELSLYKTFDTFRDSYARYFYLIIGYKWFFFVILYALFQTRNKLTYVRRSIGLIGQE